MEYKWREPTKEDGGKNLICRVRDEDGDEWYLHRFKGIDDLNNGYSHETEEGTHWKRCEILDWPESPKETEQTSTPEDITNLALATIQFIYTRYTSMKGGNK